MMVVYITYLLKEGPLGLIIKANELLHDHHLTRLPVGHLITHTNRKIFSKAENIIYSA